MTATRKLQWATYDAVSDENRLAGLKQATGRDVDLMLRFDRATVILCLDADPLLTDPEMIRHARGFADGRRAGASGGAMNRLYAVEGVFSLTGAMADHRLRLQSRQIAPFLAALAARLGAARAPAPEPASRVSTRAGSTRWPKTFKRTAARGSSWPGNASPRPSTPRSAP